MTFDGAGVNGAGQICADIVEQRLNAFVLERGTAGHRHDAHGNRSLAYGNADLIFGYGRRIIEIFFHDGVIELGDFLEHLVAPLFGFGNEIFRDILYVVVGTHRFVMPENSLHRNEVNDTFEGFFRSDRNLDRTGICTEHILDLAYNLEEVGARTVHLVHITDTGNIVFVSLTPHGL